MIAFIKYQNYLYPVYLFMSSGDLDEFNIRSLAE